jgi:hypothetical protein
VSEFLRKPTSTSDIKSDACWTIFLSVGVFYSGARGKFYRTCGHSLTLVSDISAPSGSCPSPQFFLLLWPPFCSSVRAPVNPQLLNIHCEIRSIVRTIFVAMCTGCSVVIAVPTIRMHYHNLTLTRRALPVNARTAFFRSELSYMIRIFAFAAFVVLGMV